MPDEPCFPVGVHETGYVAVAVPEAQAAIAHLVAHEDEVVVLDSKLPVCSGLLTFDKPKLPSQNRHLRVPTPVSRDSA